MITIEIEEDLLPWIIDALRNYDDGYKDNNRQELINDLEDLNEFYNED